MATAKRPRGRPHGTGKNDAPYLAQVADLLLLDQSLRPTTVMNRIIDSRIDWGATRETLLRRWQAKWKEKGEVYKAAALERAHLRDTEAARSALNSAGKAMADFANSPTARNYAEAMQKYASNPVVKRWLDYANSPAMRDRIKALENYANSPAGKALLDYANSPAVRDRIKALENYANSPAGKALLDYANSPAVRDRIKALENYANSPAGKALLDYANSPTTSLRAMLMQHPANSLRAMLMQHPAISLGATAVWDYGR
jgi:protein-arginine kinase activator protein McsA